MKYKVGDKVRVREWGEMKKEFGLDSDGNIICKGYFMRAMKKFCGKIFTVEKVFGTFYYLKGGESFCFSDDMLEPVSDKKIVITSDGKTTLARLYEDGKVTKTAKAICSPDDEFDFSIGAKMAFERLMKPKLVVGGLYKVAGIGKVIPHFFKIGEIVECVKVGRGVSRYRSETGKEQWLDNEGVVLTSKLEEKPKYYNGKAVCVEAKTFTAYTIGKIYEFKDGKVRLDNGNLHPVHSRVKNLDEWNDNPLNFGKFIELKE